MKRKRKTNTNYCTPLSQRQLQAKALTHKSLFQAKKDGKGFGIIRGLIQAYEASGGLYRAWDSTGVLVQFLKKGLRVGGQAFGVAVARVV